MSQYMGCAPGGGDPSGEIFLDDAEQIAVREWTAVGEYKQLGGGGDGTDGAVEGNHIGKFFSERYYSFFITLAEYF